MTNQDPNQIEETPAVVPQRTFAQWMAIWQTFGLNLTQDTVLSTALLPGEVRVENGVLMVFDIALYDTNTHPTNQNAVEAAITNFLSTMNNILAAMVLSVALIDIQFTIIS